MSAVTTHRFTVEEYYRMAETGVLKPDARVELLEGRIIDMPPIGPFHGGVSKQLIHLFTALAKDRWLVAVGDPVRLDDCSEPQPDLMLLKPQSDYYRKRHPNPDEVYLLIEVADSSLLFDRGEKLAAYGKGEIAEVWIVNLSDKVLEVYRNPHFTGYGEKVEFRAGEKAAPAAFPDAVIDVGLLFGDDRKPD